MVEGAVLSLAASRVYFVRDVFFKGCIFAVNSTPLVPYEPVWLPSCTKWGRLWAVWVSRSQTAGENEKVAIISAFPLKCGETCLAWGHGGDEVLHRARAAGEMQGAGGCGVRACVVGTWAEGMEGKGLHGALRSKKRFCVFHQDFLLPSGLYYTTSCQTELF